MAFDPSGVGLVVVIPDLHQHRRGPGLPHLSQGGGGPGHHPLRQGIDLLHVPGNDLRPPPSVGAGGIIEGDDAPVLTLAAGAGGVGVQSQGKVIVPAVCLADGGRGGHIRGVPGKLDAVGQQIRLHGIGHQVHEVFLRPVPGDIGIIFLRRRTQINSRHGHSPFLAILCQNTGSAHW